MGLEEEGFGWRRTVSFHTFSSCNSSLEGRDATALGNGSPQMEKRREEASESSIGKMTSRSRSKDAYCE